MKNIAVAILNWNGIALLEQFLPSVVTHSSDAEIIIIDNGSTDESVVWLQTHYPELRIIALSENLGYTGGYNKAIREIDNPITILLNSDVEVTENWLAPIQSRFDSNSSIGAVQPKVRSFTNRTQFEYAGACGGFIDELGYPFCRGRIFDTLEVDEGQYDAPLPVFWATGACLAIRTHLYKQLNGLDPRFFAHMEEIDLCWRLQRKGHECWVEPSSVVYHLGGGTLSSLSTQKTFLNFRNNLILLHKNLPSRKVLPTILARLVLDGLAGIQFLLKGKPGHTLAILRAHFNYYGQMGSVMKDRSGNYPWPITGVYQKSIVRQSFLGGLKKFSDLSSSFFARSNTVEKR